MLVARSRDGANYRWLAKLSDFGTSATVRAKLQGLTVGTLHAMAPENLRPYPELEEDARDRRVDERAVDVYAYGVLLCALWERGADPLEYIPKDALDFVRRANPHAPPERQVLITLYRLMRVEELFPLLPDGTKSDGLRPTPSPDMPPFFQNLMRQCLLRKPEARPTFLRICEDIKTAFPRPPAPAGGARADLRVVAVVQYNPVCTQSTLRFTITVSVEKRSEPLAIKSTGSFVDASGDAAFSFPFAMCSGERVTLLIGNDPAIPSDKIVPPHFKDFSWVGYAAVVLPLPAVDADAETETAVLHPAWPAEPPPDGTRVALQLNILRGSLKRSLGVLPVLMHERALQRSVTPRQLLPRELRPRFDVEYDVMLSYRETETGKAGSNFAFRLQEALELKNLAVFCYANLVKTDHWMSPLTNGIATCRVFMPIISPEYGDLDKAPWSAAELMHATSCLGTVAGPAAILPVWHSGTYPPEHGDATELLTRPTGLLHYVPEKEKYDGVAACDMRYKHVWLIVHDALRHLLD